MHEFPFHSEANPEHIAAAAELLAWELRQESHGGPNVEPATAAMLGAYLADNDPTMRQLLPYAAEHTIVNREISAGAAATLFRTALVDHAWTRARENRSPFVDASFTNVSQWQGVMAALKDDLTSEHRNSGANGRSMALAHLVSAFEFRKGATPAMQRIAGPEALTQMLKDRFPDGVRVMDWGCSIGASSLLALYKGQSMYAEGGDKFAVSVASAQLADRNGRVEQNVTQNTRKLLAGRTMFREVVGVDVFPYYHADQQMYDEGGKFHALSGLRPSERANPRYLGTLKRLIDTQEGRHPDYDEDSKFVFHTGNILIEEELSAFKADHPEPFDEIIVSYVTQELSAEEQVRAHKILCSLLSEKGILIYLQQAHIPKYALPPVSIEDLVHSGSYATNEWSSFMNVYDNMHPELGLQTVMESYDNRWQTIRILGDAALMTTEGGEPVPLRELIIPKNTRI